MQQSSEVNNSENELIYSLSPLPFDISPTSASMFSGRPNLPHPRPIPSDPMLNFVRPTQPSIDLYKSNHTEPPQTQGAHRTQKSPTLKRRSPYSDGEEEAERPLPEDATEQEKADWRRRQNTLAARKSRKRKQDQMQQLQDDVQRLSKEKDVWRERALIMKQLLISHGLPSPNFER